MDWPQQCCYFHYQHVRTELLWGPGGVISQKEGATFSAYASML